MIYIFDTLDYGRVEIDTETNQAYFAGRDEMYNIDEESREFKDFAGTLFHFIPPVSYTKCKDAILRVWQPRTISRDTRTVGRSGVQRPEVRESEDRGGDRASEQPSGEAP